MLSICIPMLKKVLPELGNFIHDTSEKVRVAMLDLLLKVKGLRAIKYWSIVPIEHILARLEVDSRFVVRRIMSLISASFVPLNHPPSQQVERCLALISSNRGAARQFYVNLPKSLGVVDTAKYILVLCRYALESTRLWSQESVSGHLQSEDRNEDVSEGSSSRIVKPSDNSSGKRRRSSRLSEREEEDKTSADRSVASTSQSGEEVFDMDSLSGLMEAVYLMFTSIVSELSSSEHVGMKEGLMKKLSVTVRELIKISDDPLLEDALVGLAGHLPSRTLPLVSQNLFNKLKHRCSSKDVIKDDTNSLMTTIVKTLVQWGRADDLLELVEESMAVYLKKDMESPGKAVKHSPKGKKKGVMFNTEELSIQTDKAMQILNDMLSYAECRPILRNKHKTKMATLVKRLEQEVHTKVEDQMKVLSDNDDNIDRNGSRRKTSRAGMEADGELSMLLAIYNSYIRLALFLCLKPDEELKAKENDGDNDSSDRTAGFNVMRNCLAWVMRTVVPRLQSLPSQMTTQSQLRYHHFLSQLVGIVLKAGSGLIMIGINDPIISDQTCEICLIVLQLPTSSMSNYLLLSILGFTYQLTQLREIIVDDEKENQNEAEEPMETVEEKDTGIKAPSKHPLQFTLLVLESAFQIISSMKEEHEQSGSKSRRDSQGSKSRLKNKTVGNIDTEVAMSGSSSASTFQVYSSFTSILTVMVKPGMCSSDFREKTVWRLSNLVISDLERLSRLEVLSPTTLTALMSNAGGSNDGDTANTDSGNDHNSMLTGLNQPILVCLKKYLKSFNMFVEEVAHHLDSDQATIHSLQGIVHLTDALRTKAIRTINPDLKEAVIECLKNITPNGLDEDVFRDVKGQVEQVVKEWNPRPSSSSSSSLRI